MIKDRQDRETMLENTAIIRSLLRGFINGDIKPVLVVSVAEAIDYIMCDIEDWLVESLEKKEVGDD